MIQDIQILKPRPVTSADRTPSNLVPPLRFEEVVISTGQLALHGYWLPASEGAPVVLYLHGQDATIGKNLHHAESLQGMGCHVLVIDYRGYGKSYKDMTPSESSVCEDAKTAWDYLLMQRGFPPEQILIYGHSLGGAVAIDLAACHPEAGGLVVESSFTSISDIVRWKIPITHLYPLTFMLRHRFDSIRKVREQTLPPTLYMHGKSDTKVPYFMTESLYKAARGPNKFIQLIEGGEHAQHGNGHDLYRTTTMDFIKKFIKPLEPAATQNVQ